MKNSMDQNLRAPRGGGPRLSRRAVLQYFAGTGAFLAAGGGIAFGEELPPLGSGYGTDPDLTKSYNAGDVWPLTMTLAQRAATTALADVILPADELGPAASNLRVPDFIDEWVSAPYPAQQGVRPRILDGLAWIDAEARKRFKNPFAALSPIQQIAICDDLCDESNAKPEFKEAARFFGSFRDLAMGAYYSTSEGWKALGYVGNVPTPAFDGPPPEVLKLLDVEQTVK